ncbi:MAG: hypothetical protein NT027_03465 [Proteobacteria bacterium]|nr:hypothetical protein [Pseudomonadota bacterium]
MICLIVFNFTSPIAFSKGENEVGFDLQYSDTNASIDGEKVRGSSFVFNSLYLRNFKSVWSGVSIGYENSRSTLEDNAYVNFGVPFKYWIKGPESKGIGIAVQATPYFGKKDDSEGGGTMLGANLGPSLVVFMSDMLGIETKLYFDYRRVGSNSYTTTGLKAGFSVYF